MPSNVENILNGILTGDGSGIQKPASRVEELLFEIYEQGGGGGGGTVIGGIKLTIDSDYIMTATLVDKQGNEYGTSDNIDLPLETMVVDGEYDSQTQKIKLELKNGNYVEFSVAELVSGLQTELSSSNKLNPAYIAYDSSHRAVSDTEKDTWNAKQNAISDLETIRSGAAAGATAVQPATMTEALAAKQNSLSETQLAAVNSGINSAKVGQIETNKTNILYAINTGVKNWLPVDNCNSTTGLYIIPRTTEVALPAGKYIFYINVTSSTATGIQFISSIGVDDGNHRTGVCTISNMSAGIHYSEVTVLSGTTNIAVYVNDAAVIPEIMLCPKELWDTLGHDFKRGALINSDLTRLQAEDRASLAEVVDSGAKNLLKRTASGSSWTDDNVTFTLNSDGSITINSSGNITANRYFAYFEGRMSDLVNTAGNYVLFASASPNAQAQVWWYYTDDWTNVVETSGNSSRYISASDLNRPVIVRIRALSGNAISNAKVYPMICTKAAFNVSQKYVPYRPNYDLVCESVYEYQDKNFACSESETYEYTGLSVTVPASQVFEILAYNRYGNAPPRGIIIADSNSQSTGAVILGESTGKMSTGDDPKVRSVWCLTSVESVEKTYYIWVKNGNTGSNKVAVAHRRIY